VELLFSLISLLIIVVIATSDDSDPGVDIVVNVDVIGRVVDATGRGGTGNK